MILNSPRTQFSYTTCTVAELIAKLQDYPSETPVLTTWEGTSNGINLKSVDLDTTSFAVPVLYIDAEEHEL